MNRSKWLMKGCTKCRGDLCVEASSLPGFAASKEATCLQCGAVYQMRGGIQDQYQVALSAATARPLNMREGHRMKRLHVYAW